MCRGRLLRESPSVGRTVCRHQGGGVAGPDEVSARRLHRHRLSVLVEQLHTGNRCAIRVIRGDIRDRFTVPRQSGRELLRCRVDGLRVGPHRRAGRRGQQEGQRQQLERTNQYLGTPQPVRQPATSPPLHAQDGRTREEQPTERCFWQRRDAPSSDHEQGDLEDGPCSQDLSARPKSDRKVELGIRLYVCGRASLQLPARGEYQRGTRTSGSWGVGRGAPLRSAIRWRILPGRRDPHRGPSR